MRILIQIFIALSLIISIGCGSEKKAPDKVSIPYAYGKVLWQGYPSEDEALSLVLVETKACMENTYGITREGEPFISVVENEMFICGETPNSVGCYFGGMYIFVVKSYHYVYGMNIYVGEDQIPVERPTLKHEIVHWLSRSQSEQVDTTYINQCAYH